MSLTASPDKQMKWEFEEEEKANWDSARRGHWAAPGLEIYNVSSHWKIACTYQTVSGAIKMLLFSSHNQIQALSAI